MKEKNRLRFKMPLLALAVLLVLPFLTGPGVVPVLAGDNETAPEMTAEEEAWLADDFDEAVDDGQTTDPLESMNRLFFRFNDRLYFWGIKPLARVYAAVLPQDVRLGIRNAFTNLQAPVRIVNNLLQGKMERASTETARFLVNTTVGIIGFGDPAGREFGLEPAAEDFGQTLGTYGTGGGMYLNWPVLGPSNGRDTLGMAVDWSLDPLNYLTAASWQASVAAHGAKRLNKASLTLGDYELFKETSLDPYVALRDAYRQYREGLIRDAGDRTDEPVY